MPDCSGQSWRPGVSSPLTHMPARPHTENGKMRYNLPLPTFCPVPDSGQSSGISIQGPLRHEAPTNLLSATSRQAPSEVLAWSPMCPEQMPGLMSGQERRSWSCPSPSISLLPGSSRAADPKCPSSVSRGTYLRMRTLQGWDYETWARLSFTSPTWMLTLLVITWQDKCGELTTAQPLASFHPKAQGPCSPAAGALWGHSPWWSLTENPL